MPVERQQPYKAIRAKTINAGVEAREMWDQLQVAAPLEMSKGPTGVLLRLAMTTPGAKVAQTFVGGVPARSGTTMGTANVTLQKLGTDGSITATTITVAAYNLSTTAVGGSSYVILMPADGLYLVIWEDCS